ncbi:MAG: SAM-dependent methyltransferase [Candidatus Azobacteroides sp.]|nr:SAM-dependent methyltransferase [Candidatus Azobacteroides sp.]
MRNEASRKFVSDHRFDDVRKLALQTSSFTGSDIDIPWALTQIEGRQSAENKIPTWFRCDAIVYPPHLALEQCSSEQTARYKAGLLSGTSFVDLTGGFGVDFAFISGKFQETCYVEKQKELCEIAAFNFKILGLTSSRIISADATDYLKKMPPVDTIFMDPGRRSVSGKKVFTIEDSEPDLLKIQDLLLEKAETILVKLSPMLDISLALKQLKNVAEVHVVSLENECKELLFLLKKNFASEALITCVNLSKKGNQLGISFLQSQEKARRIDYTSEPGRYLYEPNASLLKAGFYKGLTELYPLRKFHLDTHLYTSDQFIPDFPGRVFQIEACTSFNKKELKDFLRETDKVSLAVRNFPLSAAELRKKLKINEGGETYIFAATLANGKHILLKNKKIDTLCN